MIKYKSYTKVTLCVKESRSDLFLSFSDDCSCGSCGVALSCFKVEVPFIIPIKHRWCGRKKKAGAPGESGKRGAGGDKETNKRLMVW